MILQSNKTSYSRKTNNTYSKQINLTAITNLSKMNCQNFSKNQSLMTNLNTHWYPKINHFKMKFNNF